MLRNGEAHMRSEESSMIVVFFAVLVAIISLHLSDFARVTRPS
jgi:hypothetical protein